MLSLPPLLLLLLPLLHQCDHPALHRIGLAVDGAADYFFKSETRQSVAVTAALIMLGSRFIGRFVPKKQQQQEQKQEEAQRCYPLLSVAEKRSDAYKRVAVAAAAGRLQLRRRALRSPHNLLQEEHSFDPWRVLVICILLNLTKGTQVRDVLPSLFNLCPTAEATTKVAAKEIERVIKSLGMQRRRAKLIKRFTREYLRDDWTHVTQLCGVGKYAADAYAIFCAGRPDSVIPRDHKLVDYWKFLHSRKTTIDKEL